MCGWTPCCNSECALRSARTCTKTAKCCNNGIKTTLTGINCDKCGTYDSVTGGLCLPKTFTYNAPRRCPDGTEFDALGLLCYPKCRDGYHKNPGDIVSCWNNKPTTKLITGTKTPTITSN